MPISLLKNVFGPWEQVRGNVGKDLEQIQTHLNRLPAFPTYLPPRTIVGPSVVTPAINTDLTDVYVINQLGVDVQSFTMNLQGTPVDGQRLTIRLYDDGTQRNLTWGAKFLDGKEMLPSTTTVNVFTYVFLIYNALISAWDCI